MKKKTKIINVDFKPDKKPTSEKAHQLTKEKKNEQKKRIAIRLFAWKPSPSTMHDRKKLE